MADDDRTVTEVHIREWKVDLVMMEVLTQCWAAAPFLHTVHLWNTGLDANSLSTLAAGLPWCTRLTTLVLDNTPLGQLHLSDLLSRDNLLENLSLRWCSITDADIEVMAGALGSPIASHPTLLSLNLSGNQIGDVGVGYLADALKVSRTLLVLNLASNQITDEGTLLLAEALSWFPVTGNLLSGRHILIHNELAKYIIVEAIPQASKPDRPSVSGGKNQRVVRASGGVTTKAEDKAKKELTAPKEDKDKGTKKDAQALNRASFSSKRKESQPPKLVVEIDPKFTTCRPQVKPAWHTATDVEVLSYGRHPLLQAGYIHQGDLWLPGNRTLISLNLSRNGIGEVGVRALLAAVQEQVIPVGEGEGEGRGLLRLVLNRNAFNTDSEAARDLSHRMALKDPLLHFPCINLQKDSISPCAIPVCTGF